MHADNPFAFFLSFRAKHAGDFANILIGKKIFLKKAFFIQTLRYLQKSRDLNFIQYADELPDIADDNEDNEDISLHDIPTDTIHCMIRDMPTGYRTVFSLYAIEGLGHKEIAETLGISISTSASQYHRAKKMLAQMISEHNLQSKRL